MRMGTEKALLEVEGRPLVLRVIERISAACSPVLAAPGSVGRLGALPCPEVEDEVADAGPLGGLAAGLAASPHELMAVVAVDMPFASPGILRLLGGMHAGEDAVVPRTARGLEPLHAVYSTGCLPIARQALREGAFGLQALLERLNVRVVTELEWRPADPEGSFAVNLNTTPDLELLGRVEGPPEQPLHPPRSAQGR
jgi:molybdopterin-guanine dinucleotide biosynthesis protein A